MLTRGAPTMVVVFFGALIDTLTAFVALAAANMPAIEGGSAPSEPGGTTAGPEPPALTSCSVAEPLPLRPARGGELERAGAAAAQARRERQRPLRGFVRLAVLVEPLEAGTGLHRRPT